MNVAAVIWAFKVQRRLDKPSARLLLLHLANLAGPDGDCFQSMDRLILDTAMDKRTIRASMKHICDQKLAEATEERKGKTGRITVYKLPAGEWKANGDKNVPITDGNGDINAPLNGDINAPIKWGHICTPDYSKKEDYSEADQSKQARPPSIPPQAVGSAVNASLSIEPEAAQPSQAIQEPILDPAPPEAAATASSRATELRAQGFISMHTAWKRYPDLSQHMNGWANSNDPPIRVAYSAEAVWMHDGDLAALAPPEAAAATPATSSPIEPASPPEAQEGRPMNEGVEPTLMGLLLPIEDPPAPPAKPAREPRKTRGTRIDPAWQPTEAGIAYATSMGVLDVAALVEDFVGHHDGKGTTWVKWDIAWQNWCRRDRKFRLEREARKPVNRREFGDMLRGIDHKTRMQEISRASIGGRWMSDDRLKDWNATCGVSQPDDPAPVDDFKGPTLDGEAIQPEDEVIANSFALISAVEARYPKNNFGEPRGIPEALLLPLRDALVATLAPPTQRDATEIADLLTELWPKKPTLSAHAIAIGLSDIPPDAIRAAVTGLAKTKGWPPSISEIIEDAGWRYRSRKNLLSDVNRILKLPDNVVRLDDRAPPPERRPLRVSSAL